MEARRLAHSPSFSGVFYRCINQDIIVILAFRLYKVLEFESPVKLLPFIVIVEPMESILLRRLRVRNIVEFRFFVEKIPSGFSDIAVGLSHTCLA